MSHFRLLKITVTLLALIIAIVSEITVFIRFKSKRNTAFRICKTYCIYIRKLVAAVLGFCTLISFYNKLFIIINNFKIIIGNIFRIKISMSKIIFYCKNSFNFS